VSIARALLLRASRSTWIAEQFRRRRFAKAAVRRFMPGESVDDAFRAANEFAREGLGTVFTELGERVTNAAESDGVRDHYLSVLDRIKREAVPTHVSVKLTHLGLDIDREACVARVSALAKRAEEVGSYFWIDMEESNYVDATLDVYSAVRARHEKVGVCLQAYLRRTPADVESLLKIGPSIRLVKGAYREPPEIAYPKKKDTDQAYFDLSVRLVEGGAFTVLGTHDAALIARIRAAARTSNLEVHMLYGIQSAAQRALAASGVKVRVLISYGTNWYPWYVRRLAERPANVWFVVKNMFG
jgi:proline dehydrogenase